MILLTATTESLELITGSELSTDYSAAYADHTASAFTPGSQQANILTAATTTIVAAPAASTQRQVKLLTIRNRDLAASQTVTVQKNISGTLIRLTPDVVLAPGEVLEYLDGQGFRVLDPFAAVKGLSSVTVINPPTVTSPYYTSDNDLRMVLAALLTEQRLTNFLLSAAFRINDGLDGLRDELTVQ